MAIQRASRGSAASDRTFRLPVLEVGLISVLIAAYVSAPEGADSWIIWSCLLIHYSLILSSIRRPIMIRPGLPTFISAEFLFLTWSYLLFFLPYQLHVLNDFDLSTTRFGLIATYPDFANRAVILSAIGMLAFRAGCRSLAGRGAVSVDAIEKASKVRRLDRLTVSDILPALAVSQVLLIGAYSLFGWRAAGEGRYTKTTAGGNLAEGVYLVVTVLSMVAIVLLICAPVIGDARRTPLLWFSGSLSLLWAVRLAVAGDRNMAFLIALVATGAVLTFRIRSGRWSLALFAVAAIASYQMIEDSRSGRFDSLTGFFSSGQAFGVVSTETDTSFNLSTISVRAALAVVPDQFDYGYGIYQLIGLGGVVPLVRGMIASLGNSFAQTSEVLNAVLLPPGANWGLGTNVIVDSYMDFGVFGVPVLLFLVGLMVSYVQVETSKYFTSPFWVVMYLVTLAFIAQMPRYSIAYPIRPLGWVLLFFLAVSLLTPAAKRIGSRPAGESHKFPKALRLDKGGTVPATGPSQKVSR
jgi:oligosaccharide repeat unit polymerase